MKAIELFAGVGGFRLGLERAGIEVIWANEFDKYAAQTYNKNFSKKGHLVDERSITDIPTSEIPEHDILVGGFPCQAFSIAGKRKGFDETRGTLFFDIARILADKRPRYFVLENVKGLLNHEGGKTFATILGVCAELGYECQWQLLNSKNFGVPQNRERVYIIGHLTTVSRPQVLPIGSGDANIDSGNKERPNRIADTITTRYAGRNGRGTHIKQLVGGSQDQRIYADDGLSPTLPTMQGGNKQPKVYLKDATKRGYAVAEVGDGINIGAANSKTRRGRVAKDSANTLNTSGDIGTYDGEHIRRLTPVECERLQGFPDNWTEGVSNTQRYKQMGNAVTVNVIEAVAKKLIEGVQDER